MDKKNWIIDKVNKEWGHNKGALHATQYLSTIVKEQTTVRDNWTTFSGAATMYNSEVKWATIPLKTYKDIYLSQMIIHVMWDVFNILDSFYATKNYDLFHHTACFTQLTVVSHVEELRKTGDVKEQTTVRDNWTTFSGAATMYNSEVKWATIPLKTYKDIYLSQMIIHVMWDVFNILDSFYATKNYDLFHHTACFTQLTVVSHVEELRKTGDKHTIEIFGLKWRIPLGIYGLTYTHQGPGSR